MLYPLLRPLIFSLNPETAHRKTLCALVHAHKLGLLKRTSFACREQQIMGLKFPNPIGLAAGLDKNGEYIDALSMLGFGFIEIGTVTPRAQVGNATPRLFRIPQSRAIINRMGFNNCGIDRLIENVKQSSFTGVLGINIGKNFDTPIESAVTDYKTCLSKAYPYASYVAINISSPNTHNLRQLQSTDTLNRLLSELKHEQQSLSQIHGKYTPLVVKIAPDLDSSQIASIAQLLIKHQIDGVIATNTTLARHSIEHLTIARETGGLSGAPLTKQATDVIQQLHDLLQNQIPVIGVGGIMSATDAKDKIHAGASLIQIYSGLIYQGPALISKIANEIC